MCDRRVDTDVSCDQGIYTMSVNVTVHVPVVRELGAKAETEAKRANKAKKDFIMVLKKRLTVKIYEKEKSMTPVDETMRTELVQRSIRTHRVSTKERTTSLSQECGGDDRNIEP